MKRQVHDSNAYVIRIEDNCPIQVHYYGCAVDQQRVLKSVVSNSVSNAGRLFTIFLVLWHRSGP